MQLTKNFTDDEFRCKCGCNTLIDTPEFRSFVARLQAARTLAGIPFVINSGYRCEKHNAEVGSKPDSSHRRAIAADIETKTLKARFRILKSLYYVGFTRMGIKEGFLHVDDTPDKVQDILWTY